MALTILKTVVDAGTIEAAEWNAEFNNIYNNSLSLISPLTGNLDAGTNNITNIVTLQGAAANGYIDIEGDSSGIQMRYTDAGLLMIGDTANTKMTTGMTITQAGGVDNEAVALKNGDVTHGVTDDAEADTYGKLQKAVAATGGLLVQGYAATGVDNGGIIIQGVTTDAPDTSADATAHGLVRIIGALTTSNDLAAPVTDDVLLSVEAFPSTTEFLVSARGALFCNTGTSTNAVTVYDDEDDLEICRSFTLAVGKNPIREHWEIFTKEHEQKLIELGILGGPLDQEPLYNVNALQMLHNGAIWQLGKKMMTMEQKLLALEYHG